MAKRPELKAVSYITIGGQAVRFDSLTEEKKAECRKKMAENIGKALSSYCSANPEEARPLMKMQK